MTAQIPETLVYQGQSFDMMSEPLEDYFRFGGFKPDFGFSCSALWRGYQGRWEITGGRLYLVAVTLGMDDEESSVIEHFFPGYPGRVFAHWYTGVLRIPRGKRLHYRHMGYSSVYERDEFLEFERGVMQRTWTRDHAEVEVGRLLEGHAQ